MRTKLIGFSLGLGLTLAAVLPVGVTAASAASGGCPNDNSSNGASHANSNSAHGPDKQSARCAIID